MSVRYTALRGRALAGCEAALSRFVFGPRPARGAADEERLLALLSGHGGAVAPADLMRVGLDRARAEVVLCRAIARHGGALDVVDGAVIYRLPGGCPRRAPSLPAVWDRRLALPPVTGNRPRTDAILAVLNVLVLMASMAALARGGLWSLAVIPFALAVSALAFPLARVLGRRADRRRIARENGRRRLLRAVIERPAGAPLQAYWLSHAWIQAAGRPVAADDLLAEVRALGGEPDVDGQGRLHFRFPDLDHEARALASERPAPPRFTARA